VGKPLEERPLTRKYGNWGTVLMCNIRNYVVRMEVLSKQIRIADNDSVVGSLHSEEVDIISEVLRYMLPQ
jgi:hypothetical protein